MASKDRETTRLEDLVPPPGAEGARRSREWLVAIHTNEPTLLNTPFILEHNPTNIGRAGGNHVILGNDAVSRKHARLERRAGSWFVIDDGSTNGTYCNDERVVGEAPVRNGDRLKIGRTIFKFLSGADVEAQYHEEMRRMTIIDGLTQIHNKRYLHDVLESEIDRARKDRSELSILLFDIDHFRRVNDVYNTIAGDVVLEELCRVIQPSCRVDDVFGRHDGDKLAIILPDTSIKAAAALGEEVRRKVAEHGFDYNGEAIRITISVGVTRLDDDDKCVGDLIARADYALYIAKREGRNRVVSNPSVASVDDDEMPTQLNYRPLLDGPSLLQKALAKNPPAALLAFEIEDEQTIIHLLGSSVYAERFQQLTRDVETSLAKEDILGTHWDRYVLAALPDSSPERVATIRARVREQWTARPVPEGHRIVPRRLRSALLTAEDSATHRGRALDMLLGRFHPRSSIPPAPEDELPFPVAALKAMVLARPTALGRVKALLEGIETALRFIVAVTLGALRESEDPTLRRLGAAALVKAAHLGDQWQRVALRLASLVPERQDDPVAAMARALVRARVHGAPLAEALRKAARLHHEIARQTGLAENAHAGEVARLNDVLGALLGALEPLSALRLVSVAESEVDEDEIRYSLYLHKGPGEYFRIIQETLKYRLQRSSCYLLGEGRAPLSLAPFVLSMTCEICGRIEVGIAEEPTLGPKGARVRVRGVTTNHENSLEIPWQKRMEVFHEAVLEARARDDGFPDPDWIPPESISAPRPSDRAPKAVNCGEQKTGENTKRPQKPKPDAPITILFLGANPTHETRSELDGEWRGIKHRLQNTPYGTRFRLISEWAIRPEDLHACLLRHEPVVVHFSGHGNPAGQILVEDDQGQAFPIERKALGNLLGLLKENIRCVVLSACYSAAQADEIARHIDCVVGMTTALTPGSARAFSSAFYQALGHGKSVQLAFELGRNEIDLRALADADVPRLLVRPGVKPEEVRLAGEDRGAYGPS